MVQNAAVLGIRDSNQLNATVRWTVARPRLDGHDTLIFLSLRERKMLIESLIRPSFGNLPRKDSYRGRIHDLSDASGTDVDRRSFWVVVDLESANCAVLGIRDSNNLNAARTQRRLPPARWR